MLGWLDFSGNKLYKYIMISIQTLLNKEMDRKEFLYSLGILVLTVTGIVSIWRNLDNLNLMPFGKKLDKKVFGYGPYGGTTKRRVL